MVHVTWDCWEDWQQAVVGQRVASYYGDGRWPGDAGLRVEDLGLRVC